METCSRCKREVEFENTIPAFSVVLCIECDKANPLAKYLEIPAYSEGRYFEGLERGER